MNIKFLNMANSQLPDSLLNGALALGEIRHLRELEDLNDEYLKDVQIVLATGGSQLSSELLDNMPNLKLVACCSVGYDKIDVLDLKRRGIHCTHTPDVLNDDVADLAIAMLLNVSRSLIDAQKYIELGNFGKYSFPLSTAVRGLKVGVAGMGRIGKEIAARLVAFKTEIAYTALNKKDDLPYTYFDNIKDLATWADVLILAMPACKENYHIVDNEILHELKDGIIINIARGSLIDTEALIEALQSGLIKGAGLDVFEHEPHVPSDLIAVDNVVLSPHIGSATVKTRTAMGNLALANIKAFLEGKELITEVLETK